jgi:hypothetical protein
MWLCVGIGGGVVEVDNDVDITFEQSSAMLQRGDDVSQVSGSGTR